MLIVQQARLPYELFFGTSCHYWPFAGSHLWPHQSCYSYAPPSRWLPVIPSAVIFFCFFLCPFLLFLVFTERVRVSIVSFYYPPIFNSINTQRGFYEYLQGTPAAFMCRAFHCSDGWRCCWIRFKWPHHCIRKALHFTPLQSVFYTYFATFRSLRSLHDNCRAKMATIESLARTRAQHLPTTLRHCVLPGGIHGWREVCSGFGRTAPWAISKPCRGVAHAICIQMQVTCFYATPRSTCDA